MPNLKKTPPIHDTLTGFDFRVDPPLTRSKAIRLKCLECQCGNAAEVRRCAITDCTLWPWRGGRVPRVEPPEKAHAQDAGEVGRGEDTPGPTVTGNPSCVCESGNGSGDG